MHILAKVCTTGNRPSISQAKDCSEAGSKLAGVKAQFLPSGQYLGDVDRRVVRQNDGAGVDKLQNDLDRRDVAVGHVQSEYKVLLCTVI